MWAAAVVAASSRGSAPGVVVVRDSEAISPAIRLFDRGESANPETESCSALVCGNITKRAVDGSDSTALHSYIQKRNKPTNSSGA